MDIWYQKHTHYVDPDRNVPEKFKAVGNQQRAKYQKDGTQYTELRTKLTIRLRNFCSNGHRNSVYSTLGR
jgi:hypothetical protein